MSKVCAFFLLGLLYINGFSSIETKGLNLFNSLSVLVFVWDQLVLRRVEKFLAHEKLQQVVLQGFELTSDPQPRFRIIGQGR